MFCGCVSGVLCFCVDRTIRVFSMLCLSFFKAVFVQLFVGLLCGPFAFLDDFYCPIVVCCLGPGFYFYCGLQGL